MFLSIFLTAYNAPTVEAAYGKRHGAQATINILLC
jgi:hypothetical protein